MALTSLPATLQRILFLVFDNMDTLDFAGPFEILAVPNRICNTPSNPGPFTALTITAATDQITTSQGATLKPHIVISEVLKKLSEFDILVVPGGRREIVTSHGRGGEELELVTAFAALPPKPDGTERTILSVCTGAFLLAGAGVLEGMKATTHHQALTTLQAFVDEKDSTQVVPSRFVDGGLRDNRLRIITSGGISSGLDGSLYLLELILGIQAARMVEVVLEYKWRRDEGLTRVN